MLGTIRDYSIICKNSTFKLFFLNSTPPSLKSKRTNFSIVGLFNYPQKELFSVICSNEIPEYSFKSSKYSLFTWGSSPNFTANSKRIYAN